MPLLRWMNSGYKDRCTAYTPCACPQSAGQQLCLPFSALVLKPWAAVRFQEPAKAMTCLCGISEDHGQPAGYWH